MQHPTFSSTPFFYDRDKDRASYSGKSDQQYEGQSWRPGSFNIGNHSSPRVSYYFPKGVGEYHFGVNNSQLNHFSSSLYSLNYPSNKPRNDIL
jgi:histone deacetylase HOS2